MSCRRLARRPSAKERGREEGDEFSESLQEKAREVAPGERRLLAPRLRLPPVTATLPITEPAVKLAQAEGANLQTPRCVCRLVGQVSPSGGTA